MKVVSEHCCFGGKVGSYAHPSVETGGEMKFSVFVPPGGGPFPVLTYLAGLTCTEETFMTKAGALKLAAELGIMLVAPDTSPRGAGIPGEADVWDFGVGAGFYVDATQAPWDRNYRIYSYVTRELPKLVAAGFPARADRQGIFGHSMGGHGALVLALKNPDLYRSVSAFAPISTPSEVPWGHKALGKYLGQDRAAWAGYDATALVKRKPFAGRILIDQGLGDKFLAEQLRPELFEAACKAAGQDLLLRRHEGYDHGYYFIQTFMDDHLRHHAGVLLA